MVYLPMNLGEIRHATLRDLLFTKLALYPRVFEFNLYLVKRLSRVSSAGEQSPVIIHIYSFN